MKEKKLEREEVMRAAQGAARIEKDLAAKQKERKQRKAKSDDLPPDLGQRFVAPLIMVVLAVISYLVFKLS